MFLVCTFLKGEHSITQQSLLSQKHGPKAPLSSRNNSLLSTGTSCERKNMGLVGGSKVCTNNQSLYYDVRNKTYLYTMLDSILCHPWSISA